MHLLDPLTIRGRIVPSRVMFGPIETNLGDRRTFSSRHVAFYERRARGGSGIVVTEIASVHDSDWPYERAPLSAECGSSWGVIAGAIRPTGALVLAGLGHAGGQGTSHWNQRELWAPSPVPEVASREVPKVMETQDIVAVVDGFATAAAVATEAGLDGVEINAGQFSLIRQFISGLTNMRGDEYGQDRLRFAREVIRAVRNKMHPDAILALRLSCDEMAPWAGVTPEMAGPIAAELCGLGVDLLTVVRGSIYTGWATQPDMHVEPGFNLGLARGVRAVLRDSGLATPVVAQGSIVDVGQAEWALGDGVADVIEMTRAQLADADLVTKVRRDQSARIRPCLLCNQTCKVRDNRNPIITCVVDPRTGFETVDPEADAFAPIGTAAPGTAVTVIGGGVAGLEAARVLATAGRSVRIVERSERLGGVIRVAAAASGRERLSLVADWLEAECRTLGVEIALNLEASSVDGPTIIATGATHGTLPFSANEHARILHASEALADPSRVPDGPVAIWDPIGGPIGVAMAETLSAAGRSTTLITPDLLVGEKLALTGDLAPSQNRLHALGVTLHKRALVRNVSATTVTVEDRFGGVTSTIEAVALIACGQRLADTSIDPDERHPQAGDRVAPRTTLEAILEGRRAAAAILGGRI